MTETLCRHLAHRLAAIGLMFCLSATAGKQWLPTLLQYHPKVIQFATERADFLKDWQQGITHILRPDQGLMTGIAIAPTTSIQNLLIHTLGGRPYEGAKISLKPDYLSIIHYPQNHRPIVQAINL